MPEVKTKKVSGLRVTTKQDGFRRGGRVWAGTTDVMLSDLSEAQRKLIRAEGEAGNMLVVQDIKMDVPVDTAAD